MLKISFIIYALWVGVPAWLSEALYLASSESGTKPHVMLALAKKLGKQTAHRLVYEAAMEAHEAKRPLKDVLSEKERIRRHLSAEEIEELFDYRQNIGLCRELVDRVLHLGREEREADEEE